MHVDPIRGARDGRGGAERRRRRRSDASDPVVNLRLGRRRVDVQQRAGTNTIKLFASPN